MLFFFLKNRDQDIKDIAFYVVLFNINTLFKQVSTQLSFDTDVKLSKVIYSKVLKLFFKNSLKVIICKVLIII
jgi:hypothetical protein